MKGIYLIRYIFLGILIIMVFFILLNVISFGYIRHNKRQEKYRPTLVDKTVEEKNVKIKSTSLNFPNHYQDDVELVKSLYSKINLPNPDSIPYNFRLSDFDTSQGQAKVVRLLTNYKSGGFFLECGAGNGEFFSNTLFLENYLNWTGLLVEADPEHSEALMNVHRRAWFAQACMSLNTSAYEAYFERSSYFYGKVLETYKPNSFRVTCYPFYTFMLALNVTKIDYFSLDVEGHEVEILETIPFDKVDITVLSVEFSKARGGFLGVKSVMEQNGYKVVAEVPPDDLIFVKNNHYTSFDHIGLLQR